MSKALATIEAPKTNIQAVERYFLKGDIVLNTEQELLLQRLTFTDDKIRSRKHTRDEIISFITTRFGVTQWRAEQDITDTHRLFGKTRKINKNYVLAQHIENIEKQIQTVYEARQFALIPKYNDNLTYALNSLPADDKASSEAPFKIIFMNSGAKTEDTRTIDQILLEVDALIKAEPAEDEYLDFEDESDES